MVLINSDLEHGRQQSNQTLASKWMRTGAEYYTRHQDMYHRYLLKIAEALVGSLGAKKTVRGLSRCWMSYEKLENEWSFLHMLCAEPAVPGTVGALADRTAAPPAAVAADIADVRGRAARTPGITLFVMESLCGQLNATRMTRLAEHRRSSGSQKRPLPALSVALRGGDYEGQVKPRI